jgi:hypothetical protein
MLDCMAAAFWSPSEKVKILVVKVYIMRLSFFSSTPLLELG